MWPGVNFIKILREPFLYLSLLRSFSLVTCWLCSFWSKNINKKAARKMLMKLTPEFKQDFGLFYSYSSVLCLIFPLSFRDIQIYFECRESITFLAKSQ